MNIRTIASILATVACSGAFAVTRPLHQPPHNLAVGSYQLKLSEEARGLATLSGEPAPSGSLVITEGRQFVLETNISKRIIHRTGQYDLDGEELTLTFGEDVHLKGKAHDDGVVEIAGLKFVRKESGSVVGTWRVKTMKASMEFLADGTFKFQCVGAKSEGKYKYEGGAIMLTWTTVDGEAVDPDTMHKTMVVDDAGTFWIDNYHYLKD